MVKEVEVVVTVPEYTVTVSLSQRRLYADWLKETYYRLKEQAPII